MIDFKKYDEENPQIWEGFVKYAKQAKARGFKNYSANGIFEIMRWHTGLKGNGEFKICNNFRPDYSRKMMEIYPEFEGFFRVRQLTAERS